MSCDGNCDGCKMKDTCASGGQPKEMMEALEGCKESLQDVEHKILILSGKGGVGKSTVTYIIARLFADVQRVGILDLDLCGPSIPILFNLPHERLLDTTFGLQPAHAGENIQVVSIQFFMNSPDDALIARGPMKNGLILQLIQEVDWGETDLMLIDTPPGTSDEHLSIVSFMKDAQIDGAIIVTTPDEVSLSDVRREIRFCRKAGIKIYGIIENMSIFHCKYCNKESAIFEPSTGGAIKLCEEEGIQLLGRIPIDPKIVAGTIGSKEELPESIKKSCLDIRKKLISLF